MIEAAELFVRTAGGNFGRGRDRQAQLPPSAETAIDRNGIGVTHFLKIIDHERGPVTAAAITKDARVDVRNPLFDVALDDSLAKMHSARGMAGMPFAFLPDIEQVNTGLPGLDVGIVNGDFFDAVPGIIDQFEKLRAMQHGRFSLAQIWPGASLSL